MDESAGTFLQRQEPHARPGVGGRRALAVRGGALGDFILTLPSLRSLRDAGYEVELLTRPAYGRLAVAAGLVSGWRALDSPDAAFLTVRNAEIPVEWRDWFLTFDVVVSWVPDLDGTFQEQVAVSGAGTFYQGDWRCSGSGPASLQLALAVGFTNSRIHAIQDLFAVEDLRECLPQQLVGLHPGSGSPTKNWAWERWLEVMIHLQDGHPQISWLIITGETEEAHLPEIAAALDRAGLPWESAVGLDLTTLSRRLRSCRAFLGHDSGISHLAAACGVVCRLLFGPTDPAVWAPLGDAVRVLRPAVPDMKCLGAGEVIDWLKHEPILLTE